MLHEQKFKDLLSSTYQVNEERIVLDMESKLHGHNIQSHVTGFFSPSKASGVNIDIIANAVF